MLYVDIFFPLCWHQRTESRSAVWQSFQNISCRASQSRKPINRISLITLIQINGLTNQISLFIVNTCITILLRPQTSLPRFVARFIEIQNNMISMHIFLTSFKGDVFKNTPFFCLHVHYKCSQLALKIFDYRSKYLLKRVLVKNIPHVNHV